MNNKIDKYLPIGTVVQLKETNKKLMITGFCTVTEKEKNKIYDYVGCLYPEGMLTSNNVYLFDHTKIDKVFYFGFVNEEEKQFKEKLNKMINELKNQI